METVELYRIFESTVPGLRAEGCFRSEEMEKTVQGFQDGDGAVTVRFMPKKTGQWKYRITSDQGEWEGTFQCIGANVSNHGPVQAESRRLRYADGTRYLPFGTTCYGWVHQPEELRKQTISSLADSPFNKIRMLLFPKSMVYNNSEPQRFPFYRNEEGKWDINHPDLKFWQELEIQLLELDKLGIEADLILFHPYDRWGFATLSMEDSMAYLEYCVSRLSAFKNIWWSLANEYDLMPGKSEKDWDALAERIIRMDGAEHMLSIHNCCQPYPNREWMTHCSIQTNLCRQTLVLGWEYKKPILIDECGYEGNIEFTWGNLSAFEMVHRFWTTVCCGGYCTHGETFFREDEVLWWGKGGQITGKSVARIAFLRSLLEELPGSPNAVMEMLPDHPNGEEEHTDVFGTAMMRMPEASRIAFTAELIPMICGNEAYRLYYLGRTCPAWLDVQCPGEGEYAAEIIDIWEMTRSKAGIVSGTVRIALPATEGQAVLLMKMEKRVSMVNG